MQSSIVSALGIAFSTAMLFVQQGTATQNTQQPTDRPGVRQPAGEQPAFRPAGQRMQQQNAQLQRQMAAWLALDNQGEVELGKFAAERTQNPQVKEFAQMMVKEHSAFLDQLRPFLTASNRADRPDNPGANTPGAAERRGERPATRPGATPAGPGAASDRLPQSDDPNAAGDEPAVTPRRPLPGTTPEGSAAIGPRNNQRLQGGPNQAGPNAGERRMARGPGQNPMEQIAQQAAQNKLALTKQMLEGYQGQDFDMGYLGQQIVAHIDMLATLQAMQDHGSDEFKDVVTQGIQATENHLKQAQTIARGLEDKESGTSSSTPRPSNSSPATPRSTPNR